MDGVARGSAYPPGRFIVLEGSDGSGKSTQASLLAQWLGDAGIPLVTCRDPGGTGLGDRLRSILLDRHDCAIDMTSELLLYMASRAQLVRERIRPALALGQWVLSDRFLMSNWVYQCHAGGVDSQAFLSVAKVAVGPTLPDLTLVLDLEPEAALSRTGGARDRIEDRPLDYRRRVREGFLEASQRRMAVKPDGVVTVLDASPSPDVLLRTLQDEVRHALGFDPRP